jgi:hypothetical protein
MHPVVYHSVCYYMALNTINSKQTNQYHCINSCLSFSICYLFQPAGLLSGSFHEYSQLKNRNNHNIQQGEEVISPHNIQHIQHIF